MLHFIKPFRNNKVNVHCLRSLLDIHNHAFLHIEIYCRSTKGDPSSSSTCTSESSPKVFSLVIILGVVTFDFCYRSCIVRLSHWSVNFQMNFDEMGEDRKLARKKIGELIITALDTTGCRTRFNNS